MAAPNAIMVPSLLVASSQLGQIGQAGRLMTTEPLLATTLATPSYTFESSGAPSSRYVLAGSLATFALSGILAGCSEPAPAPIAHESALPANQGSCPPNSHDPFCQGYRASHQQMVEDRQAGHHSDIVFTGLLVGIAVFLAVVPTYFLARKRGKTLARREAAKQDQSDQPPESGPTKKKGLRALFGSIGASVRGKRADQSPSLPPPNEPPQAVVASDPVTKDTKVGS